MVSARVFTSIILIQPKGIHLGSGTEGGKSSPLALCMTAFYFKIMPETTVLISNTVILSEKHEEEVSHAGLGCKIPQRIFALRCNIRAHSSMEGNSLFRNFSTACEHVAPSKDNKCLVENSGFKSGFISKGRRQH